MERAEGTPRTIWVPLKPATTVYVGDLVCVDLDALDEGVITRGQADGAADTTNKDVPLGIVIGTNLRKPLYNSTYKTTYITEGAAAAPHTSTTEFTGVGGIYSKGDKRGMVEIDLIDPTTVIRAPIYNNAVGTAPTLLTVTTGSTDGLGVTTNATQYTPVANLCTFYLRTGTCAGQYRITDNTSTTVHTWDVATTNDIAVGDTAVSVGLRPFGISYARFGDDTNCSYFNCSETPATNYDIINVLRLDLREAGKEHVEFQFGGDHFCTTRA